MNWFKHDSDAAADAKIKKLLIKYGAEGYAIYFHCLELIAGDISESNITFQLEHDAEIIADNLKIKGTADYSGVDRVQDIMKYIIELDLFQESKGHIFCFKLLKRLDSSMTSNIKLRSLISKAKEHHDIVMTHHDKVMQEEKRIEEIRPDKNNSDFVLFWEAYPKKVAKAEAIKSYNKKLKVLPDINKHIEIIKNWCNTEQWKNNYIPNPTTWLNQERWNDEIVLSADEKKKKERDEIVKQIIKGEWKE